MKDINLLPQEYLAKKRRKKELFVWLTSVFIGVSLIFFLMALPFYVKYNLNKINVNLDGQIKSMWLLEQNNKTLQRLTGEFEMQKATLEHLKEQKISIYTLMTGIASSIPENVSLNNMSFQGDKLSINGISSNNSGIVNFALNLRNINVVKDVAVKTSEKQNNIYKFQMDIKLNKGGITN